mgnify:CR=1 FL=1
MKLLYYIPAFGNPHLDYKINILIDNLKYLYNNIRINFDILVNIYETDRTLIKKIKYAVKQCKFINNKFYNVKKGILAELFLNCEFNKNIDNYDYILFAFDDVKIIHLDINDMIEIKNKYNIQILSTKILNASYGYMFNYDELTINNFLEIFLLLMTPIDMKKFLSINDIKNKWLWSIDLLFGYYNIKVGVYNKYFCKHIFRNSDYDDAISDMNYYISKYTNFNSKSDILNNFTPIKDYININSKIINNYDYNKSYMVSCICISQNKKSILKKSIDSYFNQTYINKELIIVYDKNHPAINYIQNLNKKDIKLFIVDENLNLGQLRNLAINNSSGDFIMQWDDDDIYSIYRIEYNVNKLLKTNSDICIMNRWLVYDYVDEKLYLSNKYTWQGSIICKKNILTNYKYFEKNREEDLIINDIIKKYKTCYINNYGLYLYTFHNSNTNNRKHFMDIINCSKLISTNIKINNVINNYLNVNSKSFNYYYKISIVMLTYNNIDKFLKCINSLIGFIDDNIIEEIIIFDNNSNDNLKNILKNINHNKLKIIYNDKNIGVASGRKILFNKAKGNIIASLDSDVIISDLTYFKKSIDILNSNKNIGLVGLSGYYHRSFNFRDIEPFNYEGYVDYISGCVQIFNKDILKEVYLDEKYSPFWLEDTDFCMQIKKKGYRLYKIPYYYGIRHEYNSTNLLKKKNNIQNEEEYYKKFLYFKDKWVNENITFEKNTNIDIDNCNYNFVNHFNEKYDGLSNINYFLNEFNNYDSKIRIYNGSPDYYTDKIDKNKFNIIILPFESSMIPDKWINTINRYYNVCITTHSFLYNSFKNSGLHIPLYVVNQYYIRYNINKEIKNNNIRKCFKIGINCSTLVKRKNLENIIIACNNLLNKINIKLYIHVSFDYFGLLDKINIPDYAILSNKTKTADELAKWYSNLDCYIYPSFGEGWSMTPRESLYLSIPTIISDIPAHDELVQSGYYKVLYSDNKRNSYYEFLNDTCGEWKYFNDKIIEFAIIDVYENYKKYKNLAKLGSDWIKPKWTKNAYINNIKSIINLEKKNINKYICNNTNHNIYKYKLNPSIEFYNSFYYFIYRNEVSQCCNEKFKFKNTKYKLIKMNEDMDTIYDIDLYININNNRYCDRNRINLKNDDFVLEDLRLVNNKINGDIYIYGPVMIDYNDYTTKIGLFTLDNNELIFKKYLVIDSNQKIEKNWLIYNKVLNNYIFYKIEDHIIIYKSDYNFESIKYYRKVFFDYNKYLPNINTIDFLDKDYKFNLSSIIELENNMLLLFHYKEHSLNKIKRKYSNYAIVMDKHFYHILDVSNKLFTESEYCCYDVLLNFSIVLKDSNIIFYCGCNDEKYIKISYNINDFFKKYFNNFEIE